MHVLRYVGKIQDESTGAWKRDFQSIIADAGQGRRRGRPGSRGRAALAASEKKGLDTSIEVSVVQKRANDCQIGGNFENLVSE